MKTKKMIALFISTAVQEMEAVTEKAQATVPEKSNWNFLHKKEKQQTPLTRLFQNLMQARKKLW